MVGHVLDRLHVETFVLYLKDGISELPVCGNYQVKLIDSNTIEVDIAHEQSMNALFQILSDCGIKVLSMRNKTNRLEQLFVSMLHGNNGDQS